MFYGKSNKDEQIEISFGGMKRKCSNPSNKTIFIVMVLIFFAVLALFITEAGTI